MPLEPLQSALDRIDGDRPRTRLFIAGCPRSGTTLLLAMMRCFEDAYVEMNERPVSFFAHLRRPHRIQVCKRTHRCWKTLDKVPRSIKIIYVVRHPYDVLTSHHPNFSRRFYTGIDRWVSEFDAFEALERAGRSAEDLLVVRYEDLVRQPREVQRRMEVLWGLRSQRPFDHCHEAGGSGGEYPTGTELALRGSRRPDTRSIERWRRSTEYDDYLQDLVGQQPVRLARFLERFAYDRGDFDYSAEPSGISNETESGSTAGYWELREDLTEWIPRGRAFVLVGLDWFDPDLVPGRRAIYFRQRDGQYWGLPEDDDDAVHELERSRRSGAQFIVFPWFAFWCLEFYSGLAHRLRDEFPCLVDNERLAVFDLRPRSDR